MRREIHNSEYYNTIKIFFCYPTNGTKEVRERLCLSQKINHQYAFFKDTEKHTKNNS